MRKNSPSVRFWPVLGLISGIGIAQQIVLVRIFSIGQWYHFAYLIISIAMLGIALAGTVAALFGQQLVKNSQRWFSLLAAGLPLALWLSYELSQRIPFEGLEVVAELHQWLYAWLLYLLLAMPFFFVAGFVTLAFMTFRENTGHIYGVNLVGSGLGALLITAGMYYFDPVVLVYLLVGCGVFAGGLLVFPRRRWSFFYVVLVVLLIVQLGWSGPTTVYISKYKPLSYARSEPGVERITRAVDPLSRVAVLKSPRFRSTPGQLSGYPFDRYGPLPDQRGLFFDGLGPEPVHRFTGDTKPFRFLDYLPTAAGFKITAPDSLLILGAGGGTAILEGLYRDYEKITAVEPSPSVSRLLRGELRDFSGGLIERPRVNWVHGVPRRVAAGAAEYSHVYLPVAGGSPGAGPGTNLLNESYDLTVEAVGEYIDSLASEGTLTIPTRVRVPPRNLIRLTATVVEAAEARGNEQPFAHLAVLRSWNVGVVVFTAQPLAGERLERLVKFADMRGFDLDYHPRIRRGASPRYVVTEEPTHSQLLFRLRDSRAELYSEYGYKVRPVTDDQPYFYQFFRPLRLGELLSDFDLQRYPHTEWGFLLVLVTLLQSLVGGLVLILLPFLSGKVRRSMTGKLGIGLYFGALGLGYMALEVALIQQLMLILYYPVYSAAVVLAGLLVFSGLGSYLSETWKTPSRRISLAVVGILGWLLLLQPLTDWLAVVSAGWPDSLAISAVLVLLFPLAFCMGIPFPSGLALIGREAGEVRVAWAWAVNGATSVTGAVLAGLIALLWGYTALFIFGGVLYLLAAGAVYILH